MAIANTALMGMVTEKMSWLNQRQRVIGQNIANADTPGYQAKELAPIDFDRALRDQRVGMRMAVTDANHMASPTDADRFRVNERRALYEVAPGGNQVVLEQQMMAMSQTVGDYSFATNIYRKYMAMHRMALGRGGGGGG